MNRFQILFGGFEMIQEKSCSRCGQSKPLIYYAVNKKNKDGLETFCRPCKSGINSVRYRNSPKPKLKKRINAECRNRFALGGLDHELS